MPNNGSNKYLVELIKTGGNNIHPVKAVTNLGVLFSMKTSSFSAQVDNVDECFFIC